MIERPRTPPPVVINKEIHEPARPPIYKTRYIDVEPRCKSNLDLTYQRPHSKVYESNQLPPVTMPTIVQPLPQQQQSQPQPIPIHHTPVERQISGTSTMYTSSQQSINEIPPHQFQYQESYNRPIQRFNSQPDLTRYNQFYYPSESYNNNSSTNLYAYNNQDCIPTSQPATIINTAHGQYCVPNSQLNNNGNRKGKNNIFKSIFGCCKSKKGQAAPNQRRNF